MEGDEAMSRRPDVGALRQRVSIYNITRVDDGAGGFTRSDPSGGTLIGTFWANLKPVGAKEITQASQHVERVTHMALVRYNSAFQDGQTLRHRGVDMYIVSVVDPDNLKEWLRLLLREGGPT